MTNKFSIFLICISVLILIVAILSIRFFKRRLINDPPEIQRVIILSIDALRADSLHCYGYEKKTSPNIDAFAKASVLFRHAYSPSPWTLPAHISMFTGLYPLNHGVLHRRGACARRNRRSLGATRRPGLERPIP